ncbi:ferredoxin [Amnibacterium kyonggiense]|uniref:Ferredoxin n=1 Tax=Amnibacterium kyonggiense TaxID=595671 RepID=A0A4R7FP68_9MICO|nr:ferredoxin [Amnibacterium kyonggiense]TDS79483.1 ferredoxin [Amnibacterium kyonggiense]
MTATTLHIDWTRCRGRGACIDLVPGLSRDPWGYPILGSSGSDLPVPPQLEVDAADAVALCPVAALSLRPSAGTGAGR